LFVHCSFRQTFRDGTSELGKTVRDTKDRFLDEACGALGNANSKLLRSVRHDKSLIRFVEDVGNSRAQVVEKANGISKEVC
jgi:hypothetical protein